MITYMDFATKQELEKFQRENIIKPIKAETIIVKKWIDEWFNPGLKYTSGWRDTNHVRLYYETIE